MLRITLRREFTLVELLVVIGIIALLISVLLPALNRARDSSMTLKCLSNMRQVGQALNMYVSEQKGYLPLGRANISASDPVLLAIGYDGDSIASGDKKVYWINRLAPYVDPKLTRPFATWGKFASTPLPNLKSKGEWVFRCPTDAAVEPKYEYWQLWSSYNCNYLVSGDGDRNAAAVANGTFPKKITKIRRSSGVIFSMDAPSSTSMLSSYGLDGVSGSGFNGSFPPLASDYYMTRRHKNRRAANALFCDGHAQTLISEVGDLALRGNGNSRQRNTPLDRMLVP